MTSNETSQACEILLKSLADDDPIELQGEMIVGRGSTCDVVIEHERLSRQHAKISVGDGAVLVEDMGSTNGTFVNDVRVEGAVLAKHEDVVRFDTFAYQVFVVGGVDSSEPTVDGEAAIPVEEVLDAKTQVFTPPKSWALDDNQSADGTQVMSLDMLSKAPASGGSADIDPDFDVDVPVLICLSGEMKGKVFKFNTRDKLTKWEVGRADSCEIQIDDGSVSTNHAQLLHEGQRWKLIDLMSANGTYVNGTKGLTSYLSSGDKVRFGQIEFLFKLSGNADTTDKSARKKQKPESESSGLSIPSWAIGLVAFVVTAGVLYFLLG